MKAGKWFFNNVVMNEYVAYFIGIPACMISAASYDAWIGGVASIFMIFCLAIKLLNMKPLE